MSKTLLAIGDWQTCSEFLVMAVSSGWKALHTRQFADIPPALARQRVSFIFLVGSRIQPDWECASQAAWAINPNIPIISLADGSSQELLAGALLGVFAARPLNTLRTSQTCVPYDFLSDAACCRRSGLTSTLTLLEPFAEPVSSPIRHALDYIETNYAEEITLDDVANVAAYSRCHCSKIFKEQVGMSFVTYLNRVRIRHAIDLLAYSDRSVTEIALAVGFNDLSHFERVFRSRCQESPTQFRQHAKY